MSSTALMFVCLTFLLFAATTTVSGEPCDDKPLWAEECVRMRRSFGDRICLSRNYHMRKVARTKCRGTCGLCPQGKGRKRAQAPPVKCSRTQYGCCWDKVTPAAGPLGQGCPACVDRHRSVCRVFRWMCGKNTPNSDYIKFNCPVLCGFCNPSKYIGTGDQESMQSILSRMTWREYRQSRKSRKSRRSRRLRRLRKG